MVSIIIVIVAITAGVIGFKFAKNVQAPAEQVTNVQPIAQTKPATVDSTSQSNAQVAKSIYKNQKYNFSFSYPANFTYRDTEPSLALQKSEVIIETSIGHNVWGVTIAKDAKAEIVNDGISIEVRKRENKSANAFPASLQGDQGPTPIKREETTVGGIYAMHYIDSDLIYTSHGDVQGVNETYVVEKDGYVYTISSFGTNAEYWDALTGIVQSFRF